MGRELIDQLVVDNPKEATKIIFLVMDGASGIPFPGVGKTALQAAKKPNMDALAKKGVTGLMDPVAPGIAPGSGPGHLAVFGYDPVAENMGRGVLEALGIGLELTERHIAARCNFATVNSSGILIDRRAGRLPTPDCKKICAILQNEIDMSDEGVKVTIAPVKEHRFALLLEGEGLSPEIEDTDPNETGYPCKEFSVVKAERASLRTVHVLRKLDSRLRPILARESAAYPEATRPNAALYRGFSKFRKYRSMYDRYGLKALAVANYPMYRGVSKLLGMELNPITADFKSQCEAVRDRWNDFSFFFVHYKNTDKFGEDGDFENKVKAVEEVDANLPILTALNPNVIVVTSDHSTPAALMKHSWHPVATMLFAHHNVKTKKGAVDTVTSMPDAAQTYDEMACASGGLGRQPLMNLMGIALAHAGRLEKYGA
ncbi:MAG TPA: 2,3-bisphosphoglycerate-independent phosphoglycerate mutase [Candidatus Brocadiia bacterium]|nr:2,3-bisphosphoglycerate-independent phosphoglycerate mutase [Candidatus Brocadiia bacterium]